MPNRRDRCQSPGQGGAEFTPASADDFDAEVESVVKNPRFMVLMKQFSRQKAAISLKDLRKELGLRLRKRKPTRK